MALGVLAALFLVALCGLLGGVGGCWLFAKAMLVKASAEAADLDLRLRTVERKIASKEGLSGAAVKRAREEEGRTAADEEAERILAAAARADGPGGPAAPGPGRLALARRPRGIPRNPVEFDAAIEAGLGA